MAPFDFYSIVVHQVADQSHLLHLVLLYLILILQQVTNPNQIKMGEIIDIEKTDISTRKHIHIMIDINLELIDAIKTQVNMMVTNIEAMK